MTIVRAYSAPPTSSVIDAESAGVPFDGTTDARTALNALLAGAVSGSTIVFPPGKTALLSANVEVPVGVTNITIQGRGATLKLSGTAATGAYALSLLGPDCRVESLIVDGNSITDATGIRIRGDRQAVTGGTFKSCRAGGVYVQDAASLFSISGNTFLGDGYGVLFADASTAGPGDITDNRFGPSTRGDAIEVNTPTGRAHDIAITGNVIAGYTGAAAAHGIGIGVAHADDVTISGNAVADCGLDGIHIEDDCHGVSVTGNTVADCARVGITFEVGAGTTTPTGWTISGNTVSGCGATAGPAAIAIEGNTPVVGGAITGNVITDCGRAGATTFHGIDIGYLSKDVTVAGNSIFGTKGVTTSGVRASWPTGIAVTGNTITDRAGTPTQDYGVILEGGITDTVVAANMLTPNGVGPLDLSTVNWTSTSGLSVVDNIPAAANLPAPVFDGAAVTGVNSTMSRRTTVVDKAPVSGEWFGTYFIAQFDQLAAGVRLRVEATAAAGLTLARVGLYTVDSGDNATLVASTVNDTALFNSAFSAAAKAFSVAYRLTAGRRYAIGILLTGTTMPTLMGGVYGDYAENAVYPRVSGSWAGQSALPSSVTNASLTNNHSGFYVALTS